MEKFAMAPWSCARGMIESSAISTWLFEMGIGPKERVSRSLSLRFAALREQEKMARYDGDNKKVQDIKDRIESIENLAVKLGSSALRDKKKQRTGIAQIRPNITTLIEKQFKGENPISNAFRNGTLRLYKLNSTILLQDRSRKNTWCCIN
jgi:hypothetical protein